MRLSALRKRKAYSQTELSELVGVARSAVVRWEAGISEPQPQYRRKLAEVLGVEVGEIEYGKDQK